jgi:hypothetical protein
MPSKPFELLPAAAKAFVRDMKALFRAKDLLDQDEIASRQLHALLAFQRPKEKSLRLAEREADFCADQGSTDFSSELFLGS